MGRRQRAGRKPLGRRAMTAAERQRRHRQLTAQTKEFSMTDALLKVAPALPQTRADLLAQYKLKRKRSINDLVEEIIVKLWVSDDDFMKYVEAIYDSQAVEGSLAEDDTMAAQIIRNFARKENHAEVGMQNLHTIKLAMRVGLRRFDVDRPT